MKVSTTVPTRIDLAGGSLAELPVLTADAVYQPIQHTALLCLNRQDGSLRWELEDGYQLLAVKNSVSYVISLDKELTLLNNQTGERTLSFYLPNVDLFAQNNEDAMIFLATSSGKVLALKPK